MTSLDRRLMSPTTPTLPNSTGTPPVKPSSTVANTSITAPVTPPATEAPPASTMPNTTSQVQLSANPETTHTPPSVESAAMESVQAFFANGNLDAGERTQLLSLLNANTITLDDLTTDQQEQFQAAPIGDGGDFSDQKGVTQPAPGLQIRTVDRLYVMPQNSGQELASKSSLTDQTTAFDLESDPNGKKDVSYNFMMTADKTGRQQNGFFAKQAESFQGLAEDYTTSNPPLKPLAENMGELYALVSTSQSTGVTARSDEAAAILEKSAQALETLANIPEDAMDPESRQKIRKNINDIAAMAMAFPGLAGKGSADTAPDKFMAKTIQRERQIEGTAASGNRSRASETPDIQGALQTYTNDVSDMRTFVDRFQSLSDGLENGTFKNEAEYKQAMQDAAPGSSNRFQSAVGNLAQAQWKVQEAENHMGNASDLSDLALATQGQAQSRVDEASTHIEDAKDLLQQYEDLKSKSLGESDEAMEIRDKALALMSQAKEANEKVKSSAYSGNLSQLTSQVDQDLGALQAQATQITGVDALLDEQFARSDFQAGEVEERVKAAEDPDAQISYMVKQLETLTPGSHFSVGLGFRVGIGNQAASITAGVNVKLTAEVGYGHGAGYILKGEIAVDAKAEAEIMGLFKASVGLEKAFSGGVAFYELEDVQAFGEQITGLMSLMDDPIGNAGEIALRGAALDVFMSDHSYSGTSTTFNAEVEAVTGVSMSYNRETSTSNYNDYVDANNNNVYDEGEVRTQQNTSDFSDKLTFDLGGIGVTYARQSSSIVSSNHDSGRTGATDQSRVVIGLQMDPAAFAADPSGTLGKVISNLKGQSSIPFPSGIDQSNITSALTQSLSDPGVSKVGGKVNLAVSIESDGSFKIINSNSISYDYEKSISNGTFIGSVNGNISMSTGTVLYDSRN